ncbi:MAG: sensor histidine kinase [Bacteroidota bacterium]
MRHFPFLFLLLSSYWSFGQYTKEVNQLINHVREVSYSDSISLFVAGQKAIEKAKETHQEAAMADVFLYYGNYFYYIRNIDRAKIYFNRANKQARITKNRRIQILSNVRLIFMDYESGLNDDAEKELSLILQNVKKNHDLENTVEVINMLGILKEQQNQPRDAVKFYIEGLELAESNNLERYIAVFSNNLGLIKLNTGQIDEALIDFEKGLKFSKKINDKSLLNHIQINKSIVYILKDSIKVALTTFNDVIDYARKNNHPRELASAFVNIGSAFNGTNRSDMALSYMDSAVNVLVRHKMYSELTKAYLGKTDVLLRLKKSALARKSLEEAFKLTDITKNPADKSSCYMMLFEIENAEKNYKEALDNYLKYQDLQDSVTKVFNGKIVQGLQLKYNVQKKEAELEKEKSKSLVLEKKNQDERFIRWLTICISSIAIILIVGLVTFLYSAKLRQKQESFSEQLIKKIEEDRSRISMDLHDDIGQSLSMLKSKMTTAKPQNEEDNKVLESELSRVIEQTREISRNLYPSYLEKIGLVRSIASLSESVQSSTGIECSFDITEAVETLSLTVKTHLYRILQECTNNTIKHSGATALKISISEKNNEFTLVYQDNGSGLGNKQHKGLGLLSLDKRVKMINGSVHTEDKPSKSFKLTLKFKHQV